MPSRAPAICHRCAPSARRRADLLDAFHDRDQGGVGYSGGTDEQAHAGENEEQGGKVRVNALAQAARIGWGQHSEPFGVLGPQRQGSLPAHELRRTQVRLDQHLRRLLRPAPQLGSGPAGHDDVEQRLGVTVYLVHDADNCEREPVDETAGW